ncbi:MAG TPA: hypothetical protein VNT81_19230 [Vicinamibacterales bacterium]|nr:hypothetical protein [Vicinamibacterales bacterium]
MTKPTAHRPSALSWFVFIAGLVGAYAAAVYTYREVGLYGGPVTNGFYREWDAVTGTYQLVHIQVKKSGERIRRLHNDNLTVKRTDLTVGDVTVGIESKPGTPMGYERVGFSVANDGVIDAWAVRDATTGLVKIEISTRRNGKIDRWEHYQKDVLLRVELDTNGNGKPDRWMTYQDGIEMETILDLNEDGKPDGGN